MLPDALAFFKWYLAVTASGLLALPLGYKLFRHLPDRGYAFAKPLALLCIGYAFWLLGSLGFLGNNTGGLLLAAALVCGLGLAWLGRAGLSDLTAWLRAQRRYVLAVELFFLLAFLAMTVVRAYNPKIVATEKPMEFMFINSILRSPAFPPQDAWLSGHAISYYYFGYVMIASLARLTATASEVAFNLGLGLLFGLAATAALGVTLNLIAVARPAEAAKDAAASRSPRPLLAAFWPALLGPLMVLVAGNFYGVARLAHANGLFADLKIWTPRYDFGGSGAAGALGDAQSEPGLRAGWINVWEWLDLKGASGRPGPAPDTFNWDPGFWWWFNGARVLHDRNLVGVETEAIDEMPAFSFILGDMHPHVLALPFVILAVALALEWLLWAQAADPEAALDWRLWTGPDTRWRAALSAILLGGLAFLNTWDFPIYWFLVLAALAGGLGLRRGWDGLIAQARPLAVTGLALALLSVVAYLPFYLTFQSQAGGILPNLIYPTRFQQTVVMFGPVLAGVTLFMGWVAARAWPVFDRRTALAAGVGLVVLLIAVAGALAAGASLNPELSRFADQAIAPLTRQQAVNLLAQRRLVDSLATLFPAALIAAAAGAAAGALKKSGSAATAPAEDLRSPALFMALAMTLTGALLLIGPEFVYLRDNFGTRMNTLFKFYFQTWVLWGLVSAFGVWYLLHQAGRAGRWVTAGAMSLAVLGGLVYTIAGLYSSTGRFAGPPTLDGLAYFAQEQPADWEAILWLRANVSGTPVLAEGIGGQYWIEGRFSRIAMATGLPTVMGWPGHESQWRGQYFGQVAERESQIRALYQARDWSTARAILDLYNIEYVYVSSLEKTKYGSVYMPKFEQFMQPVFQFGDVTIFRRAGGR